MVRTDKSLSSEAARALLHRARFGHLAGTNTESLPILRSLHHAVLNEALVFHGQRGGEKLGMLGRPAVFECVEEIAPIPSYWIDKERACPATTYYRSVQVKGLLQEITDLELKAEAMTALMTRLQPEGCYLPIVAEAKMYAAVLRNLYIYALPITELTGRMNLGAQRTDEQMQGILAGLWQRGEARDLAAIELILSTRPGLSMRNWPRLPAGYVFQVVDPQQSPESQVIWLGIAVIATGLIVAETRAISDRCETAWILDFKCAKAHRNYGLEATLLKILFDHAALRQSTSLRVETRELEPLLPALGFSPGQEPHSFHREIPPT